MRANGFTLVELMVTMLVMALLASVVMMTAGPSGASAKETATRFASRIAAARDDAVLTSRPVSVWVSPSGYGFDRLQGGHWEAMTAKPFAADDWSKGVEMAVDGAQAPRSRVRFDSLGMPDQPLAIQLSADGRRAKVQIAANGDVAVR